jgi:hypothetical protein
MSVSAESIQFLAAHLDLLEPEKRAVARYLCSNWAPARLPQGIAKRAFAIYGFPVNSSASTQTVARELFLESAKLFRAKGADEA